MKKENEIVFWGDEEAKVLYCSEKDEAIEAVLDDYFEDEFPKEIEICAWKRASLENICKNRASEGVIEDYIEHLDEEYGSPDESTEITIKMKNAALEFINAIHKLYVPYNCDIVKREKVNVEEWVKENRPDWLDKG